MTTSRVALIASEESQGQSGPAMRLISGYKTGVYVIVNLRNGKRYVGSTGRSFKNRFAEHIRSLRRGQHHSRHLQSAWSKGHESEFVFSVALVCSPSDCLLYEQLFIDWWKSADSEYGYNICQKAGTCLGRPRSKESSERAAQKNRGRVVSPETREKIAESKRGGTCPREVREQISAKMRGRKLTMSPDARQRLSDFRRGRKVSEETRQRMSAAQRNRTDYPPQSAETKQKRADALRGRVVSSETRRKIGNSHRGKKLSVDSIAKRQATRAANELIKRSQLEGGAV